jgi:hypothetical protein
MSWHLRKQVGRVIFQWPSDFIIPPQSSIAQLSMNTGSGKTAAFSLPLIQCVYERIQMLYAGSSSISSSSASKRVKREVICMNLSDKDPSLDVDPSGLSCESTLPG